MSYLWDEGYFVESLSGKIMYKCYQSNIVNGTESFSLPWIITENFLQLGMWILGGCLLWPVVSVYGWPLLTILWAVLVVVVQVLLKKHNFGFIIFRLSLHFTIMKGEDDTWE